MKTREITILGLFIIAVCVVSLIPFSNSSFEGFKEGWNLRLPTIPPFNRSNITPTTKPNVPTTKPNVPTTTPNVPTTTTKIREGATTGATTVDGNVTTAPGATTVDGNVTTAPGATTVNGNATTAPGATTVNGNVTTAPGATTVNGNATTAPAATTKPGVTLNIQNFPISVNTNIEFINAVIYVIAQPIDQYNDKVSVYNLQSLVSPFNSQNSATLLGEMSNPNNLTDPRLFLQYMNWFASHCPLDSDTCTGLC
jgi:hypothetical protein